MAERAGIAEEGEGGGGLDPSDDECRLALRCEGPRRALGRPPYLPLVSALPGGASVGSCS